MRHCRQRGPDWLQLRRVLPKQQWVLQLLVNGLGIHRLMISELAVRQLLIHRLLHLWLTEIFWSRHRVHQVWLIEYGREHVLRWAHMMRVRIWHRCIWMVWVRERRSRSLEGLLARRPVRHLTHLRQRLLDERLWLTNPSDELLITILLLAGVKERIRKLMTDPNQSSFHVMITDSFRHLLIKQLLQALDLFEVILKLG